MKKYLYIIILVAIDFNSMGQNPKLISDITVVYDVTIKDTSANLKMVKAMIGATKVLYIKGSKSRSELVSANFQQTIIHDSKTDSTIILRELGNTKYISYAGADKKGEANKRFEGVTYSNTEETKTILEYQCKKVFAKLKDGSIYSIYYTPSIVPSNKEYEYQFKDLPGFVLQYESDVENGKLRVQYTATKITLSPVSSAKFDIPTTGYRVL